MNAIHTVWEKRFSDAAVLMHANSLEWPTITSSFLTVWQQIKQRAENYSCYLEQNYLNTFDFIKKDLSWILVLFIILNIIIPINRKVVKNKINLIKIRPVSFIDAGFIWGRIRKNIWERQNTESETCGQEMTRFWVERTIISRGKIFYSQIVLA